MTPSAAAELLTWDTDFWGCRVARLCGGAGGWTPAAVAEGDRWCRDHAIDVAYLSLPAADSELVGGACRLGFEVRSIEVLLGRPLLGEVAAVEGAASTVRPAGGTDRAPLLEMAGSDLRGTTRFYRDPRFTAEGCDDLYRTWMGASLDGWADEVLVAAAGGGISGGITLHHPRKQEPGSVGLLVVAAGEPWFRVTTAGQLLRGAFSALAAAGASEVTLATQAHNRATVRLLQAHGCTVRSVSVKLHNWYTSAAGAGQRYRDRHA